MAVFKGEIRSNVLKMNTSLNVILPYDYVEKTEKTPRKTMYLLHGYTESAESFTRWSNVEWLARKFSVAIVMPEVQRSCYVNMKFGMKYYDYITKELPAICGEMFNISSLPQDTFVIGQSMGGYGAMKWFLNDLEKFCGVGTLSGSFDLQKVVENNPDLADEFTALFGQNLVIGEENDVFAIAKKCEARDKKIYIACGTEDKFLADSEKLKAIFDKNGTQAKYNFERGCHDWDFWGKELPKSLEYLLG